MERRALLIGLAFLTATPSLAHDHGAGSWINRQSLTDPVSGQSCCNWNDCDPAKNVREVSGGYIVETGEFIPLQPMAQSGWIMVALPLSGHQCHALSYRASGGELNMAWIEGATRMEMRVSEAHHAKIEAAGRLFLRRVDNGEVLYALSGGEFDGELWVHAVVRSADVPVQ